MNDVSNPEISADTPKKRAAAPSKKKKNRRNLVAEVSGRLREFIVGGDLRPGDKLPSEAGLTREYSVSRTVVREAIASLRADGLVDVRHGVGVFVREPTEQGPGFKPVDRARISSMIEVLELRSAIEIEAAALAAERRSPAQEEILFERFDDLNRLIEADQPTVAADMALHLAVADATNNPRFREFLTLMGEHLIPRSALPENVEAAAPEGYMEQIQAEHLALIRAVSERDIDSAREAMRAHLKGSQNRYRRLIRGA